MEKKTTAKKTQQNHQMTLLQAIRNVAEQSKDCHLSNDFMKSVKKETQFLSKKYGITERQGCSNAVDIVIPESVTKIGARAFYLCSGLKNIDKEKEIKIAQKTRKNLDKCAVFYNKKP